MKRAALAVLVLLVLLVGGPPLYYAIFPADTPELPAPGRRIPVAGAVAVNAVDVGEGPAVVLVHGLPGSAYDWAPLTEALVARGFRVIAYDRVGYGHSDARQDGEFSVAANARELLALLEAENLRDATVVGWSYGGATSIVAARQDPSRIGRLVLVGSAGDMDPRPEPPPGAAILFSAPVMAWMAAVPPVGRGLQAAISEQAFSGQGAPDWWLPQLAANFAGPHTRDTYRMEGAGFRWDGLDPEPIARPILVIHGDDDRLAPLAVGQRIHERARDSELVVVEDGSHMLPVTHPDLLGDGIADFVSRP